jgi:hypothetical protein
MTIVSDQAPPGADYLLRRLTDVERELRELKAARRLEAATIGTGGITIAGGAVRVLNGSGDLVVQLGLLPDTTYGLAAVDGSGKLVKLSTLAFGIQAASIAAQSSRSLGTFGDLAAGAGPSVTVTIGNTGRCVVILGAMIATSGGVYTGGLMGYEISGATDRAPDVLESLEFDMSNESFSANASRAFLVENLNPGTHTITARYASAASGTACLFERRNLIVLPF